MVNANVYLTFSADRERIRRRVQVSVRSLSSGMLAYLHNDRGYRVGTAAVTHKVEPAIMRRTTDRVWIVLMRERPEW